MSTAELTQFLTGHWTFSVLAQRSNTNIASSAFSWLHLCFCSRCREMCVNDFQHTGHTCFLCMCLGFGFGLVGSFLSAIYCLAEKTASSLEHWRL